MFSLLQGNNSYKNVKAKYFGLRTMSSWVDILIITNNPMIRMCSEYKML